MHFLQFLSHFEFPSTKSNVLRMYFYLLEMSFRLFWYFSHGKIQQISGNTDILVPFYIVYSHAESCGKKASKLLTAKSDETLDRPHG